jgi:hypothetical protein
MAYAPGFPKQMVHASYAPAELGFGAFEGKPARYVPLMAHNADQEEMYRSQGYRVQGEAPIAAVLFSIYPKMLYHPDYVPSIPEHTDFLRDENGLAVKENGSVVFYAVPEVPGQNLPVEVNSIEEEAAWCLRGYKSDKQLTIVFKDGTQKTVG